MNRAPQKPTLKLVQVIRLIPPNADADTIKELESLLMRARAGQIRGIAYAAFEVGTSHAGVVGECREHPVFTRGLIQELDDVLRRIREEG